LLDFGAALRVPCGLVHWAGTETSTYWNGYMDGAVRSGERAAAEVLPLLVSRPFRVQLTLGDFP
jgi:monoamine oxidase